VYHQQQLLQQQYERQMEKLQQQQEQLRQQQQQQQQQLQQQYLQHEQPSHAARDYDIRHKLSAKQRERKDDKPQPAPSLTGSPGTVKQRVKEKKHTMKDAEVIARLKTICTEADPSHVYKNMRKIGQGYVKSLYY
jgi:p21-activated kinase 1